MVHDVQHMIQGYGTEEAAARCGGNGGVRAHPVAGEMARFIGF